MITKTDALRLIKDRGQSPNIVKHLITVGGAMRALAEHFGEDPKRWEMAGIVHDADYNIVPISEHTGATLSWFNGQLDSEIERAVTTHNYKNNGQIPESKMGWALYAVDNLAGLIVAATLVRPDKKLSGLTAESVKKRFNETSFAKGADREEIGSCSELGLSLDEFIEITLQGIKPLAQEVGL